MQFYLVKFTATINGAVSKDGLIRVEGLYSRTNVLNLISQYFCNRYYSSRVAVVIKEKKLVSKEDFMAAGKHSLPL